MDKELPVIKRVLMAGLKFLILVIFVLTFSNAAGILSLALGLGLYSAIAVGVLFGIAGGISGLRAIKKP